MIRLSLMPGARRDRRTRMQPILEPWTRRTCHSSKAPEFGRGVCDDTRRQGWRACLSQKCSPGDRAPADLKLSSPFGEEGELGLFEPSASYPLFPRSGPLWLRCARAWCNSARPCKGLSLLAAGPSPPAVLRPTPAVIATLFQATLSRRCTSPWPLPPSHSMQVPP